MKLLICIVLTIVCLELVFSLQCYICLTPTPSDQCLTKKNCTRRQNWCVSTIYGPTTSGFPFTGSRYVVRSCADKCQSTNPNFLGVVNPVSCCSGDLCNTANSSSAENGLMETKTSYYTIPATIYSIYTAHRLTS